MAKQKTTYKTADGKEFTTEADADKARQEVIAAHREILERKQAELAAMEAKPRTEIRVNY